MAMGGHPCVAIEQLDDVDHLDLLRRIGKLRCRLICARILVSDST